MRTQVILLTCLVSGCAASIATPRSAHQSRVFDASMPRAWKTIAATMKELGYRILSTNQTQGRVAAARSYRESAVAEYATDPIAHLYGRWWGLDATLILLVSPLSPEQVRVTVRSRLEGRISQTMPVAQRSSCAIVPLQSNGVLEQEVLEHLELALQPKRERIPHWRESP